jgi:Ca-activated chloride channel homolog
MNDQFFRSFLLPLAVAATLCTGFCRSALAGDRVRLIVEPAQSILPAETEGRAYVRVNLDCLRGEGKEPGRVPVNAALVIDKSGSMSGEKIEHARAAALMALDRLGASDVLSVIAFDDQIEVVSHANKVRDTGAIRSRIEKIRPGGSTALFAGVSQGLRELREFHDPYQVNRVILISDGHANVGPSSPEELARLGREAARDGMSVTTIGLGTAYNEDLMSKLAYASDGNHAFAERPRDLIEIFNKEFGDVLSVAAQDVEIELSFPEGFKPMRSLGREAKIDGRRVSLKLNQLYGGQQKYLLVEVEVAKEAAREETEIAKVELSYTDLATKDKVKVGGAARVRFSRSAKESEESVNKEVMGAVAVQVATEENERAVKLRDEGKVEEAKKALQQNAQFLRGQAAALGGAPAAAPLSDLATKNTEDAEAVSGGEWGRQRKEMRSRQHRDKSQQSY